MIEVHNPRKLETEVLHKYFRHSKFASFQRQLNYFGFRKLAGKGKMAPCSYVNPAAHGDIGSLLKIKRKATVSSNARDKQGAGKSRKRDSHSSVKTAQPKEVVSERAQDANPVLLDILRRSQPEPNPLASASSSTGDNSVSHHHVLARAAIGRGIRYSFVPRETAQPARPQTGPGSVVTLTHDPLAAARSSETNHDLAVKPEESLSQLASNYQNSLINLQRSEQQPQSGAASAPAADVADDTDPTPLSEMRSISPFGTSFCGFLPRDSSLIDLAMIPTMEELQQQQTNVTNDSSNTVTAAIVTDSTNTTTTTAAERLPFVDFPYHSVLPPPSAATDRTDAKTKHGNTKKDETAP